MITVGEKNIRDLNLLEEAQERIAKLESELAEQKEANTEAIKLITFKEKGLIHLNEIIELREEENQRLNDWCRNEIEECSKIYDEQLDEIERLEQQVKERGERMERLWACTFNQTKEVYPEMADWFDAVGRCK